MVKKCIRIKITSTHPHRQKNKQENTVIITTKTTMTMAADGTDQKKSNKIRNTENLTHGSVALVCCVTPRQASPASPPVGIFAASIKDPVLLKAHTLNPGLMTPAAASSSLAPRAPSAPWGKHSAGLAHRAGFLICATLRCQASSASAGVCQPLKCSPTPARRLVEVRTP